MSLRKKSNEYTIENDRLAERYGGKCARPPLFTRLMVLLFLVGLHFNPLEAQQPVPFLLSMFAAAGLYIRRARAIPAREARLVVLFLLVALICTVLAPRPEYLFVRLKSYGYLAASLAAGFIVYVELRLWPRAVLARWAGIGALVLLAGAALESSLEPVRKLSDAYRLWNFRFPYDADQRDIVFHGGIRPKFFSSEPSYLGKNFAFLLIVWLFTTTGRHRFLVFSLLAAVALFVIRSPTLITLPAAAVLYLIFGPGGGVFQRMTRPLKFIVGSVLGLGIAIVFALLLWDTIGDRLTQLASGNDASTSVRLTVSFAVIPALLRFNPLTGVGIGGTEAFANDVLASKYAAIWKGILQQKAQQGSIEHLVQNFPANFVVAFGMLGSAAAVFLMARIQRLAAPGWAVTFWLLFLMFSLTSGALNGLVNWSMFFVLLAYLGPAHRLGGTG